MLSCDSGFRCFSVCCFFCVISRQSDLNCKLRFLVGRSSLSSDSLSLTSLLWVCPAHAWFWHQSERYVYWIWRFPLFFLPLFYPFALFHCHSLPGFSFLVPQSRQFIYFLYGLLLVPGWKSWKEELTSYNSPLLSMYSQPVCLSLFSGAFR